MKLHVSFISTTSGVSIFMHPNDVESIRETSDGNDTVIICKSRDMHLVKGTVYENLKKLGWEVHNG